jgi:hypothetical protein
MSSDLRRRRKKRVALAVGAAYALGTVVARWRGYPMGGRVIVRCRDGHLFRTVWVPGASVKALRLGWWRFQRCPVGDHWTLVRPVKESTLSAEERAVAAELKDIAIP